MTRAFHEVNCQVRLWPVCLFAALHAAAGRTGAEGSACDGGLRLGDPVVDDAANSLGDHLFSSPDFVSRHRHHDGWPDGRTLRTKYLFLCLGDLSDGLRHAAPWISQAFRPLVSVLPLAERAHPPAGVWIHDGIRSDLSLHFRQRRRGHHDPHGDGAGCLYQDPRGSLRLRKVPIRRFNGSGNPVRHTSGR